MKKITLICSAILLGLGLSGCGKNNNSESAVRSRSEKIAKSKSIAAAKEKSQKEAKKAAEKSRSKSLSLSRSKDIHLKDKNNDLTSQHQSKQVVNDQPVITSSRSHIAQVSTSKPKINNQITNNQTNLS